MALRTLGWLVAGPLLQLLTVMGSGYAAAADKEASPPSEESPQAAPLDEEIPEFSKLWDRDPGVAFGSETGRFFVRAWLRGQLRYSDPFDNDPLTVAAMESPPGSDFELRRARAKVEGHLFDPRIGFYAEQSLLGDRPLLDLRPDITLKDHLRFRLGQYKALYNRERVDSSGKQQFVERSIATYPFTVDRQQGATLIKEFAGGTRADNWLMAGVFRGNGRGDHAPTGDEPMYIVRWQWHFMGQPVPFSQSDFQFTKKPAGSFSIAAARVRGPYTRFSTSGGGQLDGFEMGGDERYTIEQWQQGFAWRHKGFSIQQEYHQKYIEDHETGQDSTLRGGYAQAGKAWPVDFGRYTFPVELAARYARVVWSNTPMDRTQTELTVAANLFLPAHDNKFTADISRLSVSQPGIGEDHDLRFRLQWDLSF
jgi:hypothetical protein